MKIVVLAGGLSDERNVSLSSGCKVCAALRERGHQAALIDMYLGAEQAPEALFCAPIPAELTKIGRQAPDLAAVRASRSGGGDSLFGPGEKLVYGEPWRAADSPTEPGTTSALKDSVPRLDPNIAVFCDTTRDAVKGDCFHAEQPGFVNGGTGLGETILCAVSGWMGGVGDFKPRACSQVINYVSAHDNFTLWDKLAQSSGKAGAFSYQDSREDLLAQNKLAAFICFTCQGNLFLQAGEEFARTKLGDHNSYKSSPEINKLDWHRAWTFGELTDYYRQLIRLRKSLPGLCDKTPEAAKRIVEANVYRDGVVSFQVEDGGARGERLFVAYNATEHDYAIQLPSGRWTIRADGLDADQHKPLVSQDNWVTVLPRSGMLLQCGLG